MSIAGGFHRAVERAHAVGCRCVQLFTVAPRTWPQTPSPDRPPPHHNHRGRAREIDEEQAERFCRRLDELQVRHPLAHASYLINLASPDRALWKKSVEAFAEELRRADRLAIPYLVVHPGAHTTGSERAGIRHVIRALDEIHRQTPAVTCQCLLETTAGQGTSLGWRFEQLAAILDGVRSPDRLGVCFDTCHVFAAGYALGDERAYRGTLRLFDRVVGRQRIKAVHLNDSQRELGSRVDRHAHIGRGRLGLAAFRLLLNDPRFARTPMYLETPKGTYRGRDWDVINLRTLQRLAAR